MTTAQEKIDWQLVRGAFLRISERAADLGMPPRIPALADVPASHLEGFQENKKIAQLLPPSKDDVAEQFVNAVKNWSMKLHLEHCFSTNPPSYLAPSFKCLGVHEACSKAERGILVCAGQLAICVAENLVPLTEHSGY
ncbi:MAG: hypothetical protein ACR2RB_12545 [Gammaproteobacteria bacterium]